jgi:hypothetical protein
LNDFVRERRCPRDNTAKRRAGNRFLSSEFFDEFGRISFEPGSGRDIGLLADFTVSKSDVRMGVTDIKKQNHGARVEWISKIKKPAEVGGLVRNSN